MGFIQAAKANSPRVPTEASIALWCKRRVANTTVLLIVVCNALGLFLYARRRTAFYPTVIREMIRQENDVTNHRIMWLISCRHLVVNPCPFLLVIGLLLLGACTSTASQEAPLPTESDLSRTPALVLDWESRLLAKDTKVRATAETTLVQGARRSFPLLRRFLDSRNESLHLETFKIIQRIGPPAIPLLADLLGHDWASIRRGAVNELIDLAPHTERIQPALRRALRDDDSVVAGDVARALGALGNKASPSVDALVET